jgi:hypothetical protein
MVTNGPHGPERLEPSTLTRALALGLLIVILDFWLVRHAGFGISNAGRLAFLVAATGLLIRAVEWVLRKNEAEALADWGRETVRKLLTTRVIAFLWAAAVFVTLTYSSVEVVGESTAETGDASISPVGSTEVSKAAFGPDLRPAHFHFVATSPFGRPYRVDSPGYISASFPVYPFTGLRVSLGKDLLPSPSVLFRPSPGVLVFLRTEGSRIRISQLRGTKRDSIAGGSGASSFLLGREQAIPAAMIQDWQLSLAGLAGDETYGPTLLGWKRPVILAPAVPLAPGATLLAEVFSQAGNPAGSAEVVLGTDKLIDVEIPEVQTQ